MVNYLKPEFEIESKIWNDDVNVNVNVGNLKIEMQWYDMICEMSKGNNE